MPKNKVSEWSSSPGNNTDVGGINIAEGCAPSNINNAIREVMAQIKDMQAGTDGDNFTVGGNLSVTGTASVTGGITANVTGNLTGTASTATNALSLGGNLANTYAPLASPVFTGNPTAPTPVTSDNSTSLATTAYVTNKISAVSSGVVTISGGTTGLTPSSATAGAVTLGGTLNVANGGTGSTTASGARTNLGATTIGDSVFTLTNPSAITFPRFNADNTVSALNAADFRTAIGVTGGSGTVTSITAGSYLTGGTITTSGTIAVNASPSNVANAVVARDASGNFTAATITANLNGNASTATSATTATTASSATSATTATNVAGGGAGRVVFNTGIGTTSFTAAGSSGQLLQSAGTGTPTWISQSSIAAGSATNIAGGGPGQVPYNSASGTTAFLAAGTAGQVLTSNGTSAPSWSSPSNIVLLGTVNTTSGTSVSITGLSLAGYKQLQFVINRVSITSAPATGYLRVQDGTTGLLLSQFSTSSGANAAAGIATIDLTTGIYSSAATRGVSALPDSAEGQVFAGASTFSTATTSFTFDAATAAGGTTYTFDGGSITIYGIK